MQMQSIETFFVKPLKDQNGNIKYGPFIDGISSPIYVRVDNDTPIVGRLPAGAIYNYLEFGDSPQFLGPDKRCLVCVLPDETHWFIDGTASNGPKDKPGWERTGSPEECTISVTPSIQTPKYHGYLTRGRLIPC